MVNSSVVVSLKVVEASSVVFCTFWKRDFTQHQVEKAWGNLKELMENSKE